MPAWHGRLRTWSPVITTWNWIDTIAKQLDLSEVEAHEIALVLSNRSTHAGLREATVLALQRLGATVTDIVFDGGTEAVLRTNPAITAAIEASDLVINLAGRELTADPDLALVLAGGARLLTIDLDDPAQLSLLSPHPGLGQRVERARVLVGRGARLNVLSPAGTSLTVNLRGAPATTSIGMVLEPGDTATWPAGEVDLEPNEDTMEGSVVLMPGDFLWEPQHFIRSPLRLSVTKNHISEIDGDSGDADLVRSILEIRGQQAAYAIGRIRLGMNLCRGADPTNPFDPRALQAGAGPLAAGVVSLRVGTASAPLTVGMRSCTVLLDEVELISGGRLEGGLAPDVYEQAAL